MEGLEHSKISSEVTIEPIVPPSIKQEKGEAAQDEIPLQETEEAPCEGGKYQMNSVEPL